MCKPERLAFVLRCVKMGIHQKKSEFKVGDLLNYLSSELFLTQQCPQIEECGQRNFIILTDFHVNYCT